MNWSLDLVNEKLAEMVKCETDLTCTNLTKKGYLNLLVAARKYYGTLNLALKSVGAQSARKKWSKDLILQEIKSLYSKNEPLNYAYIQKNYRSLSEAGVGHFGKWDNAVEAAGLEPQRKCTKMAEEDCIKQLKEFSLLHPNRFSAEIVNPKLYQSAKYWFGTWKAALVKIGLLPYDMPKYSVEELSNFIPIILAKDKSLEDEERLNIFVSANHWFGSWRNTLFELGFKIKKKPKVKKHNDCLSIQDARILAQSRGGECLSKILISQSGKIRWRCSCAYEWEASYLLIKKGSWCPRCNKFERSIEDLHKIANDLGGECLSTEFETVITKYKWKCKFGHVFESTLGSIIYNKTWCPKCAGFGKTIKDMQELAIKRGGKCLSAKFNRMKDKLEWQCSNGHTWMATASSVFSTKTWCPHCVTYYSEEKCRSISEQLTGFKFPNCWIKIENEPLFKKRFQLDCYCKDIQIAVEHHGKQHYKYCNRWHRTKEKFNKMQARDVRKQEICKNLGIKLITVPYWISQAGDEYLINFLKTEIGQNAVNSVDLSTFYVRSPLEQMKNLAISRGGKCLSEVYVNMNSKLQWECSLGHQWYANPGSVQSGTWCPKCGTNASRQKRLKYCINDMKELARLKGGQCLSVDFVNISSKLEWKCVRGHIWKCPANRIKRGDWCRKCYLIDHPKSEYAGRVNLSELKTARCKWTKELVIDRLKEVIKTETDLTFLNLVYKGYKKLLIAAKKYINKDLTVVFESLGAKYGNKSKIWSKDLIVSKIKELNDKDISVSYSSVAKHNYGLLLAGIRAFKSWDSAVLAAGIKLDKKIKRWSDERCLSEIRSFCATESGSVIDKYPNLYYIARYKFGSWSNAVRAAGI